MRHFLSLALLCLSSCATTRPEPVEPLLAAPATLAIDSVQPEPAVNFRRPDYARSLPTQRGDARGAVPVAGTKTGVLGALHAVFGGKVKDKSRTTVNVYNAPAKVINSNVATDSGSVVDNREDNRKQKEKEKPKVDQSTHQGLASGHVVAGVVVVLVIALLAFLFFRRK